MRPKRAKGVAARSRAAFISRDPPRRNVRGHMDSASSRGDVPRDATANTDERRGPFRRLVPAPASASGRPAGPRRTRPIRTRVTALLLVPLLTLVALWAYAANGTVEDALAHRGYHTLDRRLAPTGQAVLTELGLERQASAVFLSTPRERAPSPPVSLDQQRRRVDAAIARFRREASASDARDAMPADLEERIDGVLKGLGGLTGLVRRRRALDRPADGDQLLQHHGRRRAPRVRPPRHRRLRPVQRDAGDPARRPRPRTAAARERADRLRARHRRPDDGRRAPDVRRDGGRAALALDQAALAPRPGGLRDGHRARVRLARLPDLPGDRGPHRRRRPAQAAADPPRRVAAGGAAAGTEDRRHAAVQLQDRGRGRRPARPRRLHPARRRRRPRPARDHRLDAAVPAARAGDRPRAGRAARLRRGAGQPRLPGWSSGCGATRARTPSAEAPPPAPDRTTRSPRLAESFSEVQRTAVDAAVGQAEAAAAGSADVFLNLARRSQSLLHRQLALLDAHGAPRRARRRWKTCSASTTSPPACGGTPKA